MTAPSQTLEISVHWIQQIQRGNRVALGELYDRATPVLFPLALRIVGERAAAEDVLQQVWLQVWRSADRYDARRGSVLAWLVRITRTRAIDWRRSHQSRQRRESEGARTEDENPGDPRVLLQQQQIHAQVRECVERLQDPGRTVVELAFFEGLSQSQIAARIQSPLGTVKSWARRALESLRRCVGTEASP